MKRPFRVFIVMSCLLLIVTATVSVWVYRQARAAQMRQAERELQLLLELRRGALEKYLATVRSEVVLWSSQPRVRRALGAFLGGWKALGEDPGGKLRRLYIDENPRPVDKKHLLDAAPDDSGYSESHREFHPWLRSFLEHQGYYDVFLFDLEGNLIYSVFKEQDYGTNLVHGPWRDTGLGRVFRAARAAPEADFVAFQDFAPYGPSHGQPASFIASPVFEKERPVGVFALQKPIDKINSVMQFKVGMGETGETYIVGDDFLMRSDSRFSSESTILRTRVDTETVRLALAGKTGVQVTPDYRDIPVLSAYGPLRFEGVTWATLAEIDEEEVTARALNLRRFAITGLLVVTSTGTLMAFFFIYLLAGAEKPTAWTAE